MARKSRAMPHRVFATWAVLLTLLAGCGSHTDDETRFEPGLPAGPGLNELDIPVREHFESARERVANLLAEDRDDAAMALALGDLGMLYHAYNYWEPALDCYEQAARLAPDEAIWAYYTGLVARRLGNYPLSASAFESALRLDTGDRFARVQLAINHLETGDLETATSMFESVLLSDSDNVSALTGRGRTALEQADWTNAAIYLEAASEHSKSTEILQGLGIAYRGLGHTDAARRMFEQASISALAPDIEFTDDPRLQAVLALRRGSEAHDRQAMLALAEGQIDKAEQEYILALQASPDKVDVRHNYGLLLWRKGDRDAAMAEFNTIFSIRPDYVPTHLLLGYELTVAGQYESAEAHIRSAVDADENNIDAQLMLADFLDHTDRNEEALLHYTVAITLDPQNPKGYVGSSLVLARLGRRDESIAVIDAGLKNLPGDRILLQLRDQISAE